MVRAVLAHLGGDHFSEALGITGIMIIGLLGDGLIRYTLPPIIIQDIDQDINIGEKEVIEEVIEEVVKGVIEKLVVEVEE